LEKRVARKLTLAGGRKPKLRSTTKRDWTKEKERRFVSALADTCNVTRAAAEAGVSVSAVYKRRKENAAFRAAWLEAISVAYQRLELVLLDRALNGTEKLVKRRDGSDERMTEYSNQLGLTLLKMHRDTAVEADTEMQPAQIEELRERLINKFKRLKQRDIDESQ
jgi:phage terminase small subunit